MHAAARQRFARRAAALKALAHPVRLLLLEELERGERCVCELHELAGGDFSTVSKHLALLRRAGFVQSEKRGLQVYYRLSPVCLRRLLACIDDVSPAASPRRKEVRK